ncbi:MAG: MATE family efflux transporter [Eubacterium sp.]|nr:MATE family efflux transporter [Eubacterium sp.]
MRHTERVTDLTEGVIWKKLLIYFLPLAAGTLFQQFYNAVDALVVGRFIGTQALAAVGGSPAIVIQLVIGFVVALSSGAAVVIAQRFGANDSENTSRAVGTAMTAFFLIGLVMTALMLLLSGPVLRMMRTPADTMADAILYMRVFFAGSVFMIIYNMGAGIMRAVGNSARPLLYLVISSLCNVVLDLLFVTKLSMGVEGVALATVLSQMISCMFILHDLIRTEEIYRLSKRNLRIDKKLLKRMMAIGLPTGVQSSMFGISNLILTVAINGLGTVVVASWAMSGKIDGIYWAVSQAFGTALTNFVAQNYGAGQKERIRQGSRIGSAVFLILTAALSVTILLLARTLLAIFTKDPAVQETTWRIITYFVPAYAAWTLIEILGGILRGMGDTLIPAIIMAVGICVVRIIWVFTIFHAWPTLFSVSMSYPASWLLTDLALVIYYLKKRKKLLY